MVVGYSFRTGERTFWTFSVELGLGSELYSLLPVWLFLDEWSTVPLSLRGD